ncbi:MAG: histidine kinase N-terminal 7TM domain-containing protein, partial [Acholeplasmataceae bacterium]|nr:histidine kinase N-terminal 7TM domain-containing protein [Acholeplasmataceae bacterium]
MNSVLWIIFYVFAVLSFIPVIKLEEVKSNKTHRRLWFLSLAIFMWTLIIAFKFVVEEPFVVYYLQLLTYPIVALITYLLYETFQHYTKRKTSDYFHFVFITFIVSNLLISLTNPFHQLMIQLPLTSSTTIQSFSDASYGIFFYIHAFISYLVLMVGFIKLLVFVKQDRKKNVSAFPFQLVLYSIIFGIGINVVNIFFYSFV